MTHFPTLRRLLRSLVDLILVGRAGCRWCSSHKRIGRRYWCQRSWPAREIEAITFHAGKDPEWCPRRLP